MQLEELVGLAPDMSILWVEAVMGVEILQVFWQQCLPATSTLALEVSWRVTRGGRGQTLQKQARVGMESTAGLEEAAAALGRWGATRPVVLPLTYAQLAA